MSTYRLLIQWVRTIKIILSVYRWKAHIIIISLKCNFFSLWYGWKIAHLAFNHILSLICLILWWSVLLVDENMTYYTEKKRPAVSQWKTFWHKIILNMPRHGLKRGCMGKTQCSAVSQWITLWHKVISNTHHHGLKPRFRGKTQRSAISQYKYP